MGMSRTSVGVFAVFAAALFGSTFLRDPQVNDWLFRISTLIMLATSWNLMANAGLISLGHSAFWGVGSYAAVMTANRLGLPLVATLAVAVVAGALVGTVLAIATGRLRGIFFAIATLALSEGFRISALMLPDLTGGAVGLFLKQELRPDQATLYRVGSLGALLSVALAGLLSVSPFQYASRAMRNNERAAQMLGIDPRRQRLMILAISGGMASCAGAINAWYGGYLDPEVGFTLHFTILSQIAPLLGGIYTVAGPVIGSFGIVAFSEGTRIWLGNVEGVSQLAFGVILVVCILFMPNGLYGTLRRALRRDGARRRTAALPSGPLPASAEARR